VILLFRKLVNEPDRIGDVTAEFEDSKPFEWLKPI
jgi:hypothetical protein